MNNVARIQKAKMPKAKPQVIFSMTLFDLDAPKNWLETFPPKVESTPPFFGF